MARTPNLPDDHVSELLRAADAGRM